MKTDAQLYRFHVANTRELETALRQIFRHLRSAVAREDDATTRAYTRLGLLLVACWAEARFSKLLFEHGAVSTAERHTIDKLATQVERWKHLVELGFRRHYNVPKAKLSKKTLPHSAAMRLDELLGLLEADLNPVITLRNRLAHGQWIYPLNSEGTDVVPEYYQALGQENVLSLQFKQRLLMRLADAVHDLLVSKSTFERDFDSHFAAIRNTRRDLQKRDYSKYVRMMRAKLARGRTQREGSSQDGA